MLSLCLTLAIITFSFNVLCASSTTLRTVSAELDFHQVHARFPAQVEKKFDISISSRYR